MVWGSFANCVLNWNNVLIFLCFTPWHLQRKSCRVWPAAATTESHCWSCRSITSHLLPLSMFLIEISAAVYHSLGSWFRVNVFMSGMQFYSYDSVILITPWCIRSSVQLLPFVLNAQNVFKAPDEIPSFSVVKLRNLWCIALHLFYFCLFW